MIKNKILAIIYRKNKGVLEFLALQNNPADPIYGGDFYYVVIGGVEAGEDLVSTVKREIEEETGIENIIEITETDKIYEYTHSGEGQTQCLEKCFLAEVKGDVRHLSIEHIGYQWLSKKKFIGTVHWYYSKDDLKELLKPVV
jgi:8-oxo-dGTP pyrophosphatase MutT (NUDIX family)